MAINVQGFTLIETIIYISLLSFIISSSYLSTYSFMSVIQKVEREAEIEKAGVFALQKIEYQINNNLPILLPSLNLRTPITNLIQNYTVISSSSRKTDISFTIYEHVFHISSLTSIQ